MQIKLKPARSSKPDIETVWKKYHKAKAVEYRNLLVEHYLPIVDKVAEIMARRLWPRVTADELASAGYEGLIGAVTAFDPSRGVKFETYCRQRIVGAIRDWQREIDPLGRSGRNFERAMSSAEERYHAERGQAPTSTELARQMGISHPKFVRMKRTVMASHYVPLETSSDRNDEGRIGMMMPIDDNPGPAQNAERELIREFLTRGLKEQDRLILTLYYYEKLTMAAIGAVLGVSESRVCQRHAEIVEQLRTRFADTACDLVA